MLLSTVLRTPFSLAVYLGRWATTPTEPVPVDAFGSGLEVALGGKGRARAMAQ